MGLPLIYFIAGVISAYLGFVLLWGIVSLIFKALLVVFLFLFIMHFIKRRWRVTT